MNQSSVRLNRSAGSLWELYADDLAPLDNNVKKEISWLTSQHLGAIEQALDPIHIHRAIHEAGNRRIQIAEQRLT